MLWEMNPEISAVVIIWCLTLQSSGYQSDQASLWLVVTQLKGLFWEARALVVVISLIPVVCLCLAAELRTCLGHLAFRL